ncbi:GntR family transcriptional regulator [Trueperella pyogenes]|uniref:GntR family transcriptional regulator n=1 Tax=Trueperella pyogenes TaxID=1661 RepID=UPI000E0D014E|nr:GntR family transcriptional regulator [Trueperella pyogenes]QIU85973.1 GntR family transcriptional regulator [Trueperella pyogenes]WHU61066.1 GntR family transcriptional regulator [Trueperella pyogenes]
MSQPKLKHEIVSSHIETLIRAGELSPGDALPSEQELAEELDVSRGTVRKALSDLQLRNLVRTDRGRGSFVTFHNRRLDDRKGWAEALSSTGSEIVTSTVSIRRLKEAAVEDPSAQEFVEIVRIRTLPSGTVISLETSLVPAVGPVAKVPDNGLTDGSLTATLECAGLCAEHGEQWVDVVALDPQAAHTLRRPAGCSFMRITRTTKDAEGNLVEHVTSLLDPDHFRFRHVF